MPPDAVVGQYGQQLAIPDEGMHAFLHRFNIAEQYCPMGLVANWPSKAGGAYASLLARPAMLYGRQHARPSVGWLVGTVSQLPLAKALTRVDGSTRGPAKASY